MTASALENIEGFRNKWPFAARYARVNGWQMHYVDEGAGDPILLLGVVMSGRRPLIKGFFRRCADRGCGHVFGLSRGEFDPLALMLSADPLPPSRERA